MTEERRRQQGEAVCIRLVSEMYKLGFMPEQLSRTPIYDQAGRESSKDPYSGDETVCLYWNDPRGHRIGEIKFHGDGSF